jgi:hypothetical protein
MGNQGVGFDMPPHSPGWLAIIAWEGAIVALVPLLPPPEIYPGVNVKLLKRLLAEIDAISRNRSGFLEQAARESLRRVA